jgi:hypothetical protein
MARRLFFVAVALLVVVGGALAVFALRGSDAPPPTLSSEEFASIGVADAVGRTAEVTGAAEIDGERITSAELEADLTTLVSDESRREDALRAW